MLEHFLLVGQRDAKSPNAQFANGVQKVRQTPRQKGQIYRVCFPCDEPRVVQKRRQRMSDGVATYAKDLSLPSQFVRTIQVLQVVKRRLPGCCGIRYGGIGQGTALP